MPYTVMIEWDGKGGKPGEAPIPTTYYNRLHAMGLIVRGDGNKEKSPIERRETIETKKGKGVIVQEGAVYVQDYDTAQAVALLATEKGARSVFIGFCELEAFHADARSIDTLARINNTLGNKRHAHTTFNYIVTCGSCARSYAELDSTGKFVVCKYCKSPNIEKTVGELPKFEPLNSTHDVWVYWLRTRFSTGLFVVPEEDPFGTFPAQSGAINEDDFKAVELIQGSDGFFAEIEKLPREVQLKALDAAFCARGKLSEKARFDARIAAVTAAIKMRGDATQMSLAEPKDQIDLFDTACVFGPEHAASAWLTIHHERR